MEPLQQSACLCPLCDHELEKRKVSPCMECGGDPREMKHLNEGTHSYDKVMLFGKFPIVLCDFCQIDFGTYPSYFFGLPRQKHLGFDDVTFVAEMPSVASEDLYCKACGYRLAFLNIVREIRLASQNEDLKDDN